MDRDYYNADKEHYDVEDVVRAGYNLSPIKCRYCGSLETIYEQYVGDAYCEECGHWQLEDESEV